MAFWSSIFKREQPIEVFTPNVTYISDASGLVEALNIDGMSVGQLWSTQPHLRTVVSFVARNVAQLGLHTFERVDETDRRRDRTSPVAMALDDVDGVMTTYELIFALVGDLLLYDRAYWMVMPADSPSRWMIRRLPPSWVSEKRANPFEVSSYRVMVGDKYVDVPASRILPFTAYSPGKASWGSSTVESLKQTLQEQIEAARYRAQVWKRGGRVSAVLERPKDAPAWTDEQARRFADDWYAKYTGQGSRAGGTPILEDGMQLKRIDFNAQEQQFVEAAKLSLQTVASAFHVNPTMVGQLDNANFSNTREFRKMLYGDTLAPLLVQITQRLNRFLLPMLDVDRSRFYVEFNIAAKLAGNFEEQVSAFQSAVGGPFMSRAEARARMNMPHIDGTDELIVPLNVIVGGQASPRDSGSQNRDPKSIDPMVKAAITDPQRDRIAQVIAAFMKRQRPAVLSAIGAGGDWWDQERWDRELAEDLAKVSRAIVAILGPLEAARLGFEDDFDADRTVNFLKAVAERHARNINLTTLDQLREQLASDEPDPAHVFDVGADSRAKGAAVGIGTFVAAFASTEAAKQIGERTGRKPVKTWVVTSPRPRPTHAAMSGQTVPVGELFSNGMRYPGDSSDADEVAGCSCVIVTSFE